MSILWKPGDRAVLGYRPLIELPPRTKWKDSTLSHVGTTGMVTGAPFVDRVGTTRVPFRGDDGYICDPMVLCLFPITEQPARKHEETRERDLCYIPK